jgi:hypothetical protein
MSKDKADSIVKSVGVDVAELASYKQQAVGLVEFLTHTPCKTPEAEAWYSERLSDVRGLIKVLEDNRTSLTKPLLEAKKRIDAMFSPATKPLKECETIIRDKLRMAACGRLEAERAALRLAETAAATGDSAGVMAALAHVPQHVETTGSTVRMVWKVDSCVVAEMPAEFLMPDEAALRKVCSAADKDNPPVVPGVVFRLDAALRAK